jgi:hypothetical protein
MIITNNAQEHIRSVFFGLPLTVVSADDQLRAMTPPIVIEMIKEAVKETSRK